MPCKLSISQVNFMRAQGKRLGDPSGRRLTCQFTSLIMDGHALRNSDAVLGRMGEFMKGLVGLSKRGRQKKDKEVKVGRLWSWRFFVRFNRYDNVPG